MITEDLARTIFKGSDRAPLLVEHWAKYLPLGGIDTPLRLAAYFAQVGHETGNLANVEENARYSAKRLAEVWPKRYAVNPKAPVKVPNSIALSIGGNPVSTLNHVYADRMGNGDFASGDGYKYRGRGLFQLTGKDNYAAYSRDTYNDNRCVMNPDLVAYPEDSVRSSIWFWNKHRLNRFADISDIKGMTVVINGGENGLDHRLKLYTKYCNLLGISN
jgi:putative chitinase